MNEAVYFVSWFKPCNGGYQVGNSVFRVEADCKGEEFVDRLIKEQDEIEPGAIVLSINRVE